MNKKIFLYISMAFLIIAAASAFDYTTDAVRYYVFDSTNASTALTDWSGNLNGTNSGAAFSTSGATMSGADYISIGDLDLTTATILVWWDIQNIPAACGGVISKCNAGNADGYCNYGIRQRPLASSDMVYFAGNDAHGFYIDDGRTQAISTDLYVAALRFDGSVYDAELNKSDDGNGAVSGTIEDDYNDLARIGAERGTTGCQPDAIFKKVVIYNTYKNDTFIDSLIDEGVFYNPYAGAGENPNINITAEDFYDNSSISNFTVTLNNGTSYSTTSGYVELLNVTIGNYTFNVTYNDHFNVTNNITVEAAANDTTYSYTARPHQSEIYFNTYELLTGSLIIGSSYSVNSTAGTEPFKLKAGNNYEVLTENAGYFNKTQDFNVTALDNRTINITGVYSSKIKINLTNAYTGNAVTNFSGWIYHLNSTNNRTYSTTNGTAYAPMIPGNFTIYIEAPGYSITESNYENITINSSSYNQTFSLYSNNSIYIYIKDEDTGLTITENITIVVTGANETTYYTTAGEYFLENLTDGNYTIKFSGDNYTLRQYIVTVAENSFQTLYAYLTANSETVTMNYIDEDSGASLEGVTASMSRLLGGVWTVVQSKESDITGRIQWIYTPNVKYKFTATLTGYDEKVFYLDPVIFDTYNVKLSPETTISQSPDYQGVTVTISPSQYYNNQSTNFSLTFGSPDGILETYDYNLSAPTGISISGSGTNAYGGTFDQIFNITGAIWTSTVTVNYCYDTTISDEKCYTRIYEIRDPTISAGAFTDNLSEEYGLGIFERILVTLIVTIIVTGVLSLLGGVLLGAPIGLLLMGYMSYIGFMPIWAALPSFLVGFIIIVARSS